MAGCRPIQIHTTEFTDRSARCLIVAAGARGFEREPELYASNYDHALREDAQAAAAFLRRAGPEAIEAALAAPDPLPTWAAVDRLMDEGGVSLAEVREIVEAAESLGYEAPEPDPMTRLLLSREWARRADSASLWDDHFDLLERILGEAARLAPLPESAIERIDSVLARYAGPLPEKPDDRDRLDR